MAIHFSSIYTNRATLERPVERVINPHPKTKPNEVEKPSTEKLEQNQRQDVVRTDPQVIEQLDLFRQNQQKQQQHQENVFKDNPDRATQKALSAYEGVAKASEKENFSSLLGVDIYV